jgi:hypothetical protein
MAATLDVSKTRTSLTEQLAAAEVAVEEASARVGELALDLTLGKASQSELEAARSAQIAAEHRVAELNGALGALDGREADQAAGQAEKQRKADERHLKELLGGVKATNREVLKSSADLAEAVSDGAALAKEIAEVAKGLGLNANLVARWPHNASRLIHARLHATGAVPGFAYGGHPADLERLAETLCDVTIIERGE